MTYPLLKLTPLASSSRTMPPARGASRRPRKRMPGGGNSHPSTSSHKLFQAGATQPLQIMLSIGGASPRHLVCDPGERDIWLRAAQIAQCQLRALRLSRHPGSGCQYPVGADKIRALPDGFARKAHRVVVVVANELGVGGDAVVKRRERITRAKPQRPAWEPERVPPHRRPTHRRGPIAPRAR